MKFTEYKGLDLVATGNEVLDRWRKNHAFEKSLELREGAPEFIFFEGPPSANGMPGIHHVMARSIKDAICRYKTQSGYKVNRRAGWDTHGLPVELGVEKMLGITKEDIGTKISVEEYNDACRKEVMKYTAEWVNILDIILLICFIPAAIQGFQKGFISQVIAIISIIAGVWLSVQFASEVTVWLAQYIQGSEQVLKVVSCALIFIAVIAGLALLGRLVEGTVKLIMLGWLNRLLGVVFSLVKAALIVGLVIMAFCSLNNTFQLVSEDVLNQSVLFPPLKNMAYTVFPYLKDLLFWNK